MVDVILGCCRGDDLKPKVTLQIGKIIGSARETSKGTEYVSFVGIPYAEPPIGNNMLFVFCSFLNNYFMFKTTLHISAIIVSIPQFRPSQIP